MTTTPINTAKKPGDLVLGVKGDLSIVTKKGDLVPHEQPHRREQRERAERWRSSHTPAQAAPRPLLSLFRRHA